jgi:hypothetical protein
MKTTPSTNPAVIEAGRIIAPDPIDDAAGDPIVDRVPQVRAQHKVRGVLAVLDRLAKQTPSRRFNH